MGDKQEIKSTLIPAKKYFEMGENILLSSQKNSDLVEILHGKDSLIFPPQLTILFFVFFSFAQRLSIVRKNNMFFVFLLPPQKKGGAKNLCDATPKKA